MSILDNEGHDPQGFGNQPTWTAIERLQSELSVQAAMVAFHQKNEQILKAEIERLRDNERTYRAWAEEIKVTVDGMKAEIEQQLAALWPFAMKHRINAGYCADDFRRASECFPAEPVIIQQQMPAPAKSEK